MPFSSSCSAIHSYASHLIWSGPELNSNKSYMCDTRQSGFFHGRHMRAIRWWHLGGLPCLDIIQKASRMLRLKAAVKHPITSEVQVLLQLYWPAPDSKQVIMRSMALLQLHWPIRVTDKQVRGMIWLLAEFSFVTKLPHMGQAWRCFKFALVFESTS